MDIMLAGEDQSQADQPNSLAEVGSLAEAKTVPVVKPDRAGEQKQNIKSVSVTIAVTAFQAR
eukprot:1152439-Pelagomonas_calceolata.AAC.5